METIKTFLQDITEKYEDDLQTPAKKDEASDSELKRRLQGDRKPAESIDSNFCNIWTGSANTPQNSYVQAQLAFNDRQSTFKDALDATLQELREILHRRGRLSSRNESLDELCKLLFAHVMSITHGQEGISRESIFREIDKPASSAFALREFVKKAFEEYLPFSLAHEINPGDFDLTIKANENTLADEIIYCFEKIAPKSGFDEIYNMGHIDLLNDVFGKFLADSFLDEKELGQYLTPAEVVRFMVQLAIRDMAENELQILCNPDHCSEFGIVLDPSCGTASFLTEFLKELSNRIDVTYGSKSVSQWIRLMVNNAIIGIDKSERMIRLALTNMAMFGFPAAKLHLANALTKSGSDASLTASLNGKVKLILTNPPFGAEFESKDISEYQVATHWARRAPTSVVSEVLLLERYIDWLVPGGQCLVIVPDSILTNKGIYGDLQNGIAGNIEIRGVISLPPITFAAAGTSTKTSILYFRKISERNSKRAAYFAVCQNIGYDVATRETKKTKIINGKSDLPRILEEFFLPDQELTIGRKIAQVETTARWDANYNSSLSLQMEQRIKNASASDILLSDIAELVNDRVDPRKFQTKVFEYIEISDVDPRTCVVHTKTVPCEEAPSRAKKRVRAGDVLFSTVRPERKVVGVVREDQNGAICTTGFAVLRPRNVDPITLAYLLKTDFVIAQILRNNVGIAYPAVEEVCLLDVLIPATQDKLTSLEVQAKSILALENQVKIMRESFLEEITRAISLGAKDEH